MNRNVSIVDHDEADMLQEDADIHVITQTKIRNEIYCTAIVNTQEIRFKIDTKCNVLPLDLFKKVQKKETINKQSTWLHKEEKDFQLLARLTSSARLETQHVCSHFRSLTNKRLGV